MEVEVLLPGDWVEVRSAVDVLATLDGDQSLDGLRFMPEMQAACGRRYRVALRAERTCVHPPETPFRRLAGAVVLDGVRCDGSQHGGCQLGCMIFWKEAWLRPLRTDRDPLATDRTAGPAADPAYGASDATPTGLRATRADDPARYACQATGLIAATVRGEPLWHPGQYLRLLRTRTFTPLELGAQFARPIGRRVRRLARVAARRPPASEAPPEVLGLVPGEWVEVRSGDDIARTLDARGTHRGLWFGGEMHAYCGRRMRVLRRVERVLDEQSGRIRPVRDTVVLEGGNCDRYFGCARGMPLMWREAWLLRVERAAPAPIPGAVGG